MDNVTEVPCVSTPRFRPLLVRKDLDKRIMVHRRTVAAHFEPTVKQVVFLVGVFRAAFHFF